MSYIIVNDQHYKDIAHAVRSKLVTDREYTLKELAPAIACIPSTSDGSNEPMGGVFYLNPNDKGRPRNIKVINCNHNTFIESDYCGNRFSDVQTVDFINCPHITTIGTFRNWKNLMSIILPENITELVTHTFADCDSLQSLIIPPKVTTIGHYTMASCVNLVRLHLPASLSVMGTNQCNNCGKLEFVTLEQGFNCNNLDISASTKFSAETLVAMFEALADRTGLIAYTLTIGSTNLAKLSEDDLDIALSKNWEIK